MRRLDPPRSRGVPRPAWPRVLRRRAELAPEIAREPHALATRAEESRVPKDGPHLGLSAALAQEVEDRPVLDAVPDLREARARPGPVRPRVHEDLLPAADRVARIRGRVARHPLRVEETLDVLERGPEH